MSDYQKRPQGSRDEFSRDFDRGNPTLSLRDQLKKWGTPEEKKMIAALERNEEDARRRKKQDGEPRRYNIVPDFSKHDIKKEW